MINCWIPWRYYISQCFQNHIFPFWNPYQQLGYPIHADLQGPTWYIESILLSMTTGQTNYTVHFLFIFYVFMAGTGMYFLSLCFHSKRNVALLVGISYMLSGFFAAHVQHFYAVIGAAWLPFIILNYYKMYTEKSYLRALYVSVFMFFNLTGGNHTFSIILIYLFITLFLYFTYTSFKENNKKDILTFVKLNALFAFATLLMAAVVLAAFYQTAPYVSRLNGLSYDYVSECPLSPQSLLSFLVPLSTVNSGAFFNTDPSMSNVYIGIVMLVFIILSFINKKSGIEKVLLGFALVCLIMSFGAYTPLHKVLSMHLPFLNLFRFPSYYSLFSILIFLLLGGKQLACLLDESVINWKKIKIISISLFSLVMLLVVAAWIKNNGEAFFFLNHFPTVFDFVQAASLKQSIILQGFVQLVFLGVLMVVLFTSLKKHWLKITTALIFLDLFIALQVNIGYLGFSPTSPKELHDYITSLPQNFPIPGNNAIADNTNEIGQKHGLYKNTSIFHKRISFDVFNSYTFKNYYDVEEKYPLLKKAMLANPLFYFSDKIYPESATNKLDSASVTHKTVMVSEQDYKTITGEVILNNTDTLQETIAITFFSPNEITVKASATIPQLLTLLQCSYTGWEALIDNQVVPVYLSNHLTMSVVFPKGEHAVTFRYTNPAIIKAGIVSYSSFLVLLLILSVVWIKKYKNYLAPALIWLVIVGSVLWYFH